MKSLMCLLQEVLLDRGTWCRVSTTNDWKTIVGRVEHEGLPFLAVTLPSFADDLQKGLDDGKVDSQLFVGWKRPRGGGLPLFLGGFLGLVFDRATGLLLDEPNIDAIQAIRQITLMFAKIKTDGLVRGKMVDEDSLRKKDSKAISKFIECEQDVRTSDAKLEETALEQFHRVGMLLFAHVLQRVDEDIYYGRVKPKHGPGATADRLVGNHKYEQSEWTQRLEELFPFLDGYVAPREGTYVDFEHVDILEPGAERPVRVITVPKTLKTPRVIAIEPAAMQYTQQAIAESLVGYLEGKDNPYRSLIGFRDQDPNREMAREGSLTGALATLDLSEASDRVSNQHVRLLVSRFPHVARGLDATRSRKADVPGHGVVRLAKFASMGSALCFPVEAMVFCTLVFCGIEEGLKTRLTPGLIRRFKSQVRVYGDDIIVPVDFARSVVGKLEDFGLRVNTRKSFWTGKFRESCGKEYYDGEDVSIVRVRTVLPTSRRDATELISTVSLRNQLYEHGYWGPVRWLDDYLEKLMPLPRVASTSPVLGRTSFLGYEVHGIDRYTHSPFVRGLVVKSDLPESVLDGWGALLKFFLKRGEDPFEDQEHLMRSGRPMAVGTKPRKASPF
uniref:RNA-directed RNA polymerase n=1 Tax=Leviviridae sp. TaxID=2027243 RepID=A0A514CZS5_9VIRU|nr:MAG: RNA-dependent RNA polymerase [Leviviridae sp.]